MSSLIADTEAVMPSSASSIALSIFASMLATEVDTPEDTLDMSLLSAASDCDIRTFIAPSADATLAVTVARTSLMSEARFPILVSIREICELTAGLIA